jgi:hypothetical protein
MADIWLISDIGAKIANLSFGWHRYSVAPTGLEVLRWMYPMVSSAAADFTLHPSDEDLSLGTPVWATFVFSLTGDGEVRPPTHREKLRRTGHS